MRSLSSIGGSGRTRSITEVPELTSETPPIGNVPNISPSQHVHAQTFLVSIYHQGDRNSDAYPAVGKN